MITLKVLFLICLPLCNTYNILGIFNLPTKSHLILTGKLFNELAKRGHNVTFITPFSQNMIVNNLTEIEVEEVRLQFPENNSKLFEKNTENIIKTAFFQNNALLHFTEIMLKSEKVQNLLKSNIHFDVLVLHYFFNDALMGIGRHFKAPIILFAPMPLFAAESFLLSHPSPSSYVPNILAKYSGEMNFWERVKNSFYDTAMVLYYNYIILPKHQRLVKKYIPGNLNLYNIYEDISLTLINSHVSTNEPNPLVPNALEIGGFHLREAKTLPKNLKRFLDKSTNGAIYFSLGSYLRSIDLPQEKKNALINTFSKLKHNVLWKFEDTNITSLPKNVKVMKWVPQFDVLAHPNVKLFISHGGLLGTIESVYHSVPILGIPIFTDQKMNIAFAKNCKYAVDVPFQQLTSEKLTKAINEVLNNPKYLENVKLRSQILRDRPIKPLDNAVYWIEYVIRYRGALHLKYPGMKLNWFQRNLLDVIAFVILLALLPLSAIIVLIKSKQTIKFKSD